MKHGYPYKSDRKYFLIHGMFILLFIAFISLYHFAPFTTTGKLFLYLALLLIWAYSEYHHRVVMSPLTFDYGKTCGKLELMEEIKKDRKINKKRNH